ncbi:MAG: hypothetical protein IPI91_19880 [Flavobacteriales bacterium]|nr:hypothetical protein [Flavobacteriales bacterium]
MNAKAAIVESLKKKMETMVIGELRNLKGAVSKEAALFDVEKPLEVDVDNSFWLVDLRA